MNREVELINKWKEVDTADEELEKTRGLYMKKMKEFNGRWRRVEKGQLEIKQNLVKFNNFVREKQGKVEGGLSRAKHEIYLQQQSLEDLKNKREESKLHAEAKSMLSKAVEEKKIFSDYLESVVNIDVDTYPDVRQLMERCQGLVATR